MASAAKQREPFRLPQGGLVERGQTLDFSFDGTVYSGHPGDTLASALLANGVRLVGRSFKYHRPRGIFSAGIEEPNALVELRHTARREPNIPATMAELYDGLDARSQNRWPSLAFDIQSINSVLSPFLSAGFYYKTFMWPASFWNAVYEPLIRRSAGLGRAALEPDPDHYEKATAYCEVLVIGSGPAGLMAAVTAARAGARVILAEQDFTLGGRLLSEQQTIDDAPAGDWVAAVIAELRSLDNVRLMPRTTVFGVYDQGTYGAIERVSDHVALALAHQPRHRGWRIMARHAVLAAGAMERGIAFGDNDRPGVMLASAVRSYVNRFGVAPGKRAVVFTTGDDGWRTVKDLSAAGVDIAAVVDARDRAVARDEARPWPVLPGGVVERALGGQQLRAVTVRHKLGGTTTIPCDLLAVANGWNPTVHLTCHLGGRPVWDDGIKAFVPGTLPPGMSVAGVAAGHLTLAEALADGAKLGAEAAATEGFSAPLAPLPVAAHPESAATEPLWRVKGSKGKVFVDLQNDVTAKDIELAAHEGYGAVEHVKRYTTLGMATDQGKTANVTGLAVLAEIAGCTIPEIGTTTFRPPFSAVSFGAFAGHHRGKEFRPARLPPSHDWAKEQGAVFVEAGLWVRAQYFHKPGDKDIEASIAREVETVRASVGVCDVSTLGKIDVQGPDAGAYLDRIYINKLSTLAVGKARYGLMLREDGIVMDDGTVARMGPEHFVTTTTTANAGKVFQHMEFCRQVLWPELGVSLVSVTDQWAQYSIAGPRSRDVLRKLVDPAFDISDATVPFMGVAELTICGGVEARLFRVSFSGERAYELAVPALYGDATIRAVMEAGAEFGITPYGTEALNVLRIEKGHAAGPEVNGQTTAGDLGLGKMMSTNKDFIGRVLAARPALTAPSRPMLIGVKPVDPSKRLTAGAHFIPLDHPARVEYDQGHLTSVAWSPTLGHDVGIGFLADGRDRIGERVRVVDLLRGHDFECHVVSPVFIDPSGERVRG
jgi:heterotetrameric sarcosine oxidase alpha subunit